jgi:outer membrane protein assembly factor BamB
MAAVLASDCRAETALIRDEDLERLLKDSDSLAARREWSLVATLLQRVIDEGRDAAMVDEVTGAAIPLAIAAERRLARFPPEGLQQYRLQTDGAARALLQAAGDREQRLAEVVERYFFTRVGDDAAWELAGRAFDAGDVVYASVLLERLAALHPDPTPDRRSIDARRLAAAAMLGDRVTARRLFSQITDSNKPSSDKPPSDKSSGDVPPNDKPPSDKPPSDRSSSDRSSGDVPFGEIRVWLEEQRPSSPDASFEFPWRDPARRDFAAAARSLRTASMGDWSVQLITESFVELESWRVSRASGLLRLSDPEALARGYDDILPRSDAAAAGRRWLRANWPSNPLMTHASPSHAAADSANALELYWTRNDGWSSWKRSDAAATTWRERWTQRRPNQASDDATLPSVWRMVAADQVSLRDPPRKLAAIDAFIWADALRHAVTVVDDTVFAVEPREVAAATPRFAARRQWSWRTRGNELAAYDRGTGDLRWRRGAEEFLPPDQDADATILGPVVSGDHGLFAPLLGGSTLYIVSFSPTDGSTRWRCRVAGEPREGVWPWSTAAVATAGRQIYANLGAGLIVAIGQDTGALRWLARYPRTLTRRGTYAAETSTSRGQPAASGQSPTDFPNGWDEERLVVAGQHLICVASDTDLLRVFDRRTGALAWESPRDAAGSSPANQLIGATDRMAVVAGPHVIRAYDLATGRLSWEHNAGRLAGRAAVLGSRDGEAIVAAVCLAEPLARSPLWLGIDDPLAGAGPRAELLTLDADTGAALHRRPITQPVRPPLDVVPADGTVLLADRAGFYQLATATADTAEVAPTSTHKLADGPSSRVTGWQPLVRLPLAALPAATAITTASATANTTASASATAEVATEADQNAPVAEGTRMLLCDLSRGVIVECDRAGRELWSHAGLRFPGVCCGWGDSRRWVLDHDRCRFVELNGKGQPVAEWAGLPGRPASLRALPNGAALAAFPDLGVVGVVEANGVWRWTFRCLGRPVDAALDRHGRVWVALGGDSRITVFDTDGRVLRFVELPARPRTVQLLGADALPSGPPKNAPGDPAEVSSAQPTATKPTDTKQTDTKQTEAKPTDEAKPTEAKSASPESTTEIAYLLPDLGQLFRVAIPLEMRGDGDAGVNNAVLPRLVQAGGRNARWAHWFSDGGCLIADAASVRCLDVQGRLLWKREGDIAGGIAVFEARVE